MSHDALGQHSPRRKSSRGERPEHEARGASGGEGNVIALEMGLILRLDTGRELQPARSKFVPHGKIRPVIGVIGASFLTADDVRTMIREAREITAERSA
jgi:hypothetical protein